MVNFLSSLLRGIRALTKLVVNIVVLIQFIFQGIYVLQVQIFKSNFAIALPSFDYHFQNHYHWD